MNYMGGYNGIELLVWEMGDEREAKGNKKLGVRN
jgi:hypothetical protein